MKFLNQQSTNIHATGTTYLEQVWLIWFLDQDPLLLKDINQRIYLSASAQITSYYIRHLIISVMVHAHFSCMYDILVLT